MDNNIQIPITSTETVFKIVKTSILKNMPTGMFVTKHTPTFDFGFWDHKPYYNTTGSIKETLKAAWCSSIINHFIFDMDTNAREVQEFINENKYEVHGRGAYLIYCLTVPFKIHNETDAILQVPGGHISDTFSHKIFVGDYCVYVNDFVKHLLLY